MELKQFKVITFDFNTDEVAYYDILPYFRKKFEETHPKKADLKTWILAMAKYQFWSRCQYEILVTGFPNNKVQRKIDVYNQIAANVDIIYDILNKEFYGI